MKRQREPDRDQDAAPLTSPTARYLATLREYGHDGELRAGAATLERAHLPDAHAFLPGGPAPCVPDGVTLAGYDPIEDRITIRCEHSAVPSFWLTLSFTRAQLDAYVAQETLAATAGAAASGSRAAPIVLADDSRDEDDDEDEDAHHVTISRPRFMRIIALDDTPWRLVADHPPVRCEADLRKACDECSDRDFEGFDWTEGGNVFYHLDPALVIDPSVDALCGTKLCSIDFGQREWLNTFSASTWNAAERVTIDTRLLGPKGRELALSSLPLDTNV